MPGRCFLPVWNLRPRQDFCMRVFKGRTGDFPRFSRRDFPGDSAGVGPHSGPWLFNPAISQDKKSHTLVIFFCIFTGCVYPRAMI
jgi:hypothetical protein